MNEKILEYVRKSKEKGLTKEDIRKNLQSIGVGQDEIDNVFKNVKPEYCPKCGQKFTPWETKCWKCGFNPESGKIEKTTSERISPIVKPLAYIILIFAVVFIGYFIYTNVDLIKESTQKTIEKIGETTDTSVKSVSQKKQNILSLGINATASQLIYLNPPIELDFKTKSEIYEIRKNYVNQYPKLTAGGYEPSSAVFGQIEDNKPWWGLQGQLCNGPGQKSIEGYSEESRFLANPYMLLGIDEGTAYIISGPCKPVYPKPTRLYFDGINSKAEVTYDIKTFLSQKQAMRFDTKQIKYEIVSMNARDFGYHWVYVEDGKSNNIGPTTQSTMFTKPTQVKNYLHRGGSCGYRGGCNNGSPKQPEIGFIIQKLPAKATFKLWKNKPDSRYDTADFTYTINFS